MATYPHLACSPASFNAEAAFLNERRSSIDTRSRRNSILSGVSDDQSDLLPSSRKSSTAGHRATFSRTGLTPLTPVFLDSAVDDDDDTASLLNESGTLRRRMTARSSFASASVSRPAFYVLKRASFQSVYGSNLVLGGPEATPLLISTPIPLKDIGPSIPDPDDNPYIAELTTITKYTLPILTTQCAQYSLLVSSVVFVGRLGTVELAAASLGSMTCNVLAFCFIQGFASALDSLCPAAFASSEPTLSSLYAQRTAVLLVLLMIPQTALFWNAENILLMLRQDPEIASKAGLYLKVMTFSLPAYGGFEIIRKWLQGQGRFSVPAGTVLTVAPINMVLTYFFVLGPVDDVRFGFIGAPIATTTSLWMMFIISFLYSVFLLPKDAWGGWRMSAFTSLGTNLKLGLAGTCMIGAEWLAWEIVGICTSYISPVALASQSILGVITSLAYQIPFAASAACAVRVGGLIGSGYAKLSKKSSRVGLMMGLCIGLVEGTLLLYFRNDIGKLFISDPDAIRLIGSVLPIIALFQVSDAVCGIASGILRGAGRAAFGAIVNVLSYYVIVRSSSSPVLLFTIIPIGFALTFSRINLGLQGLWAGLTVSLSFTAMVFTVYIIVLDWQAEVIRANKIISADMTSDHRTQRTDYGTIEE